MAKSMFGEFKVPELKLPKIDVDAVFDLQKGNLAAMQESQRVVLEAAQAVLRLSHGYAQELASSLKAMVPTDEPAKPEAVLADVQAATQKAVSVAKQGVELGVAAQQRVVELVGERVTAGVKELTAGAA